MKCNYKIKMKKASLSWDELGKWVLFLILLVVLIIVIVLVFGGASGIWERIKEVLRFGVS